MSGGLILAPLRGVTIRTFREVFAEAIREAGFSEALTPFIPAIAGFDPMKDRELAGGMADPAVRLTPQFIGKDPVAFGKCLERVRAAGYATADLNLGCPYPMVRNKGRGSGLMRTPDVLRRMLEAGCTAMGAGALSVKARLGVDGPDELLALMPLLNVFPLRFLTVHARTARQMYEGTCDEAAFERVAAAAKMPVVRNGDLPLPDPGAAASGRMQMIGRAFVRQLGERDDIADLLLRYIEASERELCGERPILGRMKELLSYWKDSPRWRSAWRALKLARSLDELSAVVATI